jgi:hypothetical protein
VSVPKICLFDGRVVDLYPDLPADAGSILSGFADLIDGVVARYADVDEGPPEVIPIIPATPMTLDEPLAARIGEPAFGSIEPLLGPGALQHRVTAHCSSAVVECASGAVYGPSFALFPAIGSLVDFDPAAETEGGLQLVVPLMPIYGGRTNRLRGYAKFPHCAFVAATFNIFVRPDSDALFVELDKCPYCGQNGYFPPAMARSCTCLELRGIPSYSSMDLGPLAMLYSVEQFPHPMKPRVREAWKFEHFSEVRKQKRTPLRRRAPGSIRASEFQWWREIHEDPRGMIELLDCWTVCSESCRKELFFVILRKMVMLGLVAVGLALRRRQWVVWIPSLDFCWTLPIPRKPQQTVQTNTRIINNAYGALYTRHASDHLLWYRVYFMASRCEDIADDLAKYLLGFSRSSGGETLQTICRTAIDKYGITIPRELYPTMPICYDDPSCGTDGVV